MTLLKLLDKIPIISIVLLVAFLLGADRGQTSSSSTTAFNQKVTTTTPIFNSNTNSKLRLIERPWLTAQRQSRVALVIGNGSYEEAPLRNPVNDATDIAAALKNLGFELIDNRALLNLNKREMNHAIDKFRERLRQGGVGILYYAGHGVAIDGVNYLIPINADLDAKEDVEYEAIPLRKVINNMEATETQLNFIIVDACRDNPIYRQWPADRRSGRRPQGFAEEKENLARGTLIFYATRYGRTARDGRGRNSTFTTHLLKHIGNAKLRVVDLMSKVADGVEQETDFEQVPWQEGSIRGGPFFLSRISEPDPTPQPISSPPTTTVEPGTTLISKATGVDYTRLRNLLASGEWKEADWETTDMVAQALGEEGGRFKATPNQSNFSCEDLRIIDQLWIKYSQGKFGFSVQKNIFVENNIFIDWNVDSPVVSKTIKFWFHKVGWESKQQNLELSSNDFGRYYLDIPNLKNALRGQLPYDIYTDVGGGNVWIVENWVRRTIACNI